MRSGAINLYNKNNVVSSFSEILHYLEFLDSLTHEDNWRIQIAHKEVHYTTHKKYENIQLIYNSLKI